MYDHTKESSIEACGLDDEVLEKHYNFLVETERKTVTLSQFIESIEILIKKAVHEENDQSLKSILFLTAGAFKRLIWEERK